MVTRRASVGGRGVSIGARGTRSGVFAAMVRIGTLLVLGVVPVVLTVSLLAFHWHRGDFLFDFKGGMYDAGTAIAHGHDPYRDGLVARLAAEKRAGDVIDSVISVPVYPAPTLVAFVPFSLLPYPAAGVLFVLLSVAALVIALRLLDVRDWRCYGAAFLSWPVAQGLMLGAITPLLVLGAAAVWRWRESVWRTAVLVAAVVVAKVLLWPLWLWLLFERRFRTLPLSLIIAGVALLVGWTALCFAGLIEYPRLLRDLATVNDDVSVSLVAGLLALGVGVTAATLSAVAVGLALLIVGLHRKLHGAAGRFYGLAIVASLLASPLVWPHYLALLFVPIALLSRRLSPAWFVPLLAWIAPIGQTTGHEWAVVPYLAIIAVIGWLLVAPRRSEAVTVAPAVVSPAASKRDGTISPLAAPRS